MVVAELPGSFRAVGQVAPYAVGAATLGCGPSGCIEQEVLAPAALLAVRGQCVGIVLSVWVAERTFRWWLIVIA